MLKWLKIGKLAVSFHKTSNKEVIVILPGLARNRNERLYVEFARFAEKNGISALRFDFEGIGESNGSSLNFNIFSEVKNVKTIVRYLVNKNFRKIGLLGHSHTGIVTIVSLASIKEEALKCAVIWNGAFRPLKFWSKREIEHLKKHRCISYRGIIFGKRMYEIAKKIKPEKFLKKVKKPVLLIHSKEDEQVPIEESKFAHKFLPNSYFQVIAGDHFFSSIPLRRIVFKLTLSGFRENFK